MGVRSRWLLVLVIVLGLAATAIGTAVANADRGLWVACVLAATALVGALVQLMTSNSSVLPQTAASDRVDAAADRLALRMQERWTQEAGDRGIESPAPAIVQWQWGAADVAIPMEQALLSASPGLGPPPLPNTSPVRTLLDAGAVVELHQKVYLRLPHGRLVLIGAAGAGKTAGMLLLLLASLEFRAQIRATDPTRLCDVPVPVWLSLGGWDPHSTSLLEWAAAGMRRDHPFLRAAEYGPDVIGELLNGPRVALFLDGLDEMPAASRGRALDRLDAESRRLRVVMTSRVEEYREALRSGHLHNAAVIELLPLTPAAAGDFLMRDRLAEAAKWQLLAKDLCERPDSVAARTLNNPLTLSLTRLAYQGKDPTDLLLVHRFPTVQSMRSHLLGRFLDTAYPDPSERAHATEWMTWIARHMGDNHDFAWWLLPTWLRSRDLRLTRGLVAGVPVALVIFPPLASVGHPVAGALVGLWTGLIPGLWFGVFSDVSQQPRNLAFRAPRFRSSLEFFWSRAAPGDAVRLYLPQDILRPPMLRAFFAQAVRRSPHAWLFSVFRGTLSTPSDDLPSATALTTYRDDRRTSILIPVLSGLSFALLGAVISAALGGSAAIFPGAFAGGFDGFFFVWVMRGSAVRSLYFADLALFFSGRGPVHLARVIRTAHERQVLRQAGALYQFRHAELQEYLKGSLSSTEA
jgi:hypothetical protein